MKTAFLFPCAEFVMLPRYRCICPEEAIHFMFVPRWPPCLCEPANRPGARGVSYAASAALCESPEIMRREGPRPALQGSSANCRGPSPHTRMDYGIYPGSCLSHRQGAKVQDFRNLSRRIKAEVKPECGPMGESRKPPPAGDSNGPSCDGAHHLRMQWPPAQLAASWM